MIGDCSYSSWSLRGWLLHEKLSLPVNLHTVRMKTGDFHSMLAGFPPARLVPAARPDGVVVYDTLALAETLNEHRPPELLCGPAPNPLPAGVVDHGHPENALCPYSGRPVTHFMELDGRVFGFCSALCRDKTLADAEVWNEFMSVFQK